MIPEEIRNELKLAEGSRLDVRISGDDKAIVINPKIDPEEFIALAEGFLKQGSPVKAADPLRLKEIWTNP